MKTFLAINLKNLRVQNKLTQKQVADKINVSQRAYAFYETGDREPNISTLTKIAELYNTSVDFLIGRFSNSMNTPPLSPTNGFTNNLYGGTSINQAFGNINIGQ